MMAGDTILPLRVENVSYAVAGEVLLQDVSFELLSGKKTIILGPNGSGKTLTLRLCHGLLSPTSGRIVWNVQEAIARRRQAMVFERPLMLRRSTAANVAYVLALAAAPRWKRRELTYKALARTGLSHVAHRSARVLSAGEQKRLALARAWVADPDVLFLDEPTSNLDPGAVRLVEDVVDAIHCSGTKIVMTTHDLGQARRLGDEVLFLHRGCLLEHQEISEFFTCPATAEARSFLRGDLTW